MKVKATETQSWHAIRLANYYYFFFIKIYVLIFRVGVPWFQFEKLKINRNEFSILLIEFKGWLTNTSKTHTKKCHSWFTGSLQLHFRHLSFMHEDWCDVYPGSVGHVSGVFFFISLRRELTSGGKQKTELTGNIARDPVLICLGGWFTLDRSEKPNLVTNWTLYPSLFIFWIPDGGVLAKLIIFIVGEYCLKLPNPDELKIHQEKVKLLL